MTGGILFGTDGVRGIAGQPPLVKSMIRAMGRAAAKVYRSHLREASPLFLMGRDTRKSGSWIARAFAEGAQEAQVVCRDVGVISTPSLAYLVPQREALGGVMISASHNPAEFNGIKLFGPDGRKCPDAWERAIEREAARHPRIQPKRVGIQKDSNALKDYLSFIRATIPTPEHFKKLRLVIDCSNGSLSKIAPAFFRSLGVDVVGTIGCRPNGKNINEKVGSQHPERMQRAVLERRAHGGVAFDGDADRTIFCDERGRLLDGDYLLAYATRCLKEEGRLTGNRTVLTVMANLGLVKALEKMGVTTAMTPVGDRYVSEELHENGGVLGGEQSGHIIFREYLPSGDGLLTALQILSHLATRKHAFSQIASIFERYPQVLLNVPVRRKLPIEDCPDLQSEIKKARAFLGDQGRVVVRYSGTEPLLRIMLEGPNRAQLEKLSESIAARARRTLGAV